MSKKRFFIYFTSTILLISLPISLAISGTSVKTRIQRETESLNKLNKEIEKSKKELSRLKEKENTITRRLNTIDRKIQITDKEIAVLNIKLNNNRKEGGEIRKELGKTKEAISKNSTIISKNMRRLHKNGKFSFMKAILSSSSFSDFLRRAKYARILSKEEAKLLKEQKEDEKKLRAIQVKLNNTENKIQGLIGGIKTKQGLAIKEKSNKRAVLRDIAAKKEVYLKHKKEAENAAKKLLSLLSTLKEKKKTVYIPKQGTTNFAKMKGKLPWPIAGRIISSYGKTKNPKFNVYTFHNGIEIETRPGRSIKSVHSGKVIFNNWFEGYGKLVIVDNGSGYYSLYGHLNSIDVSVGDNVSRGDRLGESGETGSLNGYTLYFEIRKDGKPINPLLWLNKNKRVA